MISHQAGDLETAADLIPKAIAIHKTGVSYYVNLGTVLNAQGKLDEAEALYRHALTLRPNLTEVHVNLGNVLQARGEFDASVECYQQALALKPDSAEAYNNVGNARQEQGQMDAAIACYERALAIKPDYAEVYYNLGNASRVRGNLDEAVGFYECALAIKHDYAEAFYNLGNVRRAQGDVDEALRQFGKALALRPEYAQAGFGEALAQLLQGNFSVGWDNFERRWQSMDHDTPRRAYAQPAWTGERLASGSLLIWGEQGVGDEIMFAGLIPEVVRTGNRCILDCNARLKPLFAPSFANVVAVSGCGPDRLPELEIAAHLPCGSLPRLFRRTRSDFAATATPYLFADSSVRDQLLTHYADGRRLIGLAWYTNNVKTGGFRSIDLSLLAPLFNLNIVRWISLQYGDHDLLESQIKVVNAPVFVDRAVDQLADMDLFAAQIAAMDLVIIIDNSTAHLAGALGVPVWVLLPFAPDWRWLLEREDSPWYPTMRLFRQPIPGDWSSVVKTVRSALADKDANSPSEAG
jgi:Tfp pilus assembly protein PilF